MIEKRRWPRIHCEWEAIFRSITRGPETRSSTTVDLSAGGVRFRSNHFVAVGDRMRFTIRPPKGAALETVLSTVWVREIPNLSQYEIGGSFEDVSQEGRECLRSWTDEKQAVLITRVPEASF